MERGIFTKKDAVDRLSFMKKAYDKIGNYGFKDKEGNTVNTCGAISFGNHVYVSNNHFVGKILVPDDNPAHKARYWNYDLDENNEKEMMNIVGDPPINREITGSKPTSTQDTLFYNYLTDEWEENYMYADVILKNMKVLKSCFFNWRDNLLKIKKDLVLDELDNIFGRKETEKVKFSAIIKPNISEKTIIFNLMPIAKKDEEKEIAFEIPMHIAPHRTAQDDILLPAICSINCYYLYSILRAFAEYDIVDLAYDNNFNSPIILKGVNPRVEWKPDIRFAVAQARPKYSFPGKTLY